VIERGKPAHIYLFGGSSEKNKSRSFAYHLESSGKKEYEPEDKYLKLITHVTDRLGHDRRYAMDWSSSRQELGWEPTTSFDRGIENTVAWYLDHPKWWEALM